MRNDRSVLFVDDEEHIRTAAEQALSMAGYHVECVDCVADASSRLSANWPGVVVTDVKMPVEDGLSLLQKVRDLDPELPVILVTCLWR